MLTALHRIVEPLRWQDFDGDWVVYLPRAGALVQLDPFNATVLSLVEEAPASKESVARMIASATELPLSTVLVDKVSAAVDDLCQGGLLEVVDGAPAW